MKIIQTKQKNNKIDILKDIISEQLNLFTIRQKLEYKKALYLNITILVGKKIMKSKMFYHTTIRHLERCNLYNLKSRF